MPGEGDTPVLEDQSIHVSLDNLCDLRHSITGLCYWHAGFACVWCFWHFPLDTFLHTLCNRHSWGFCFSANFY